MGFGTASVSSPRINQLSIQSSSLGLPIPLGWGTGRIRCNLIWYNDFVATAHTKKSGGKGGGVKQTTYTYTASVIMGLCSGEVIGIPTIYRDKDVFQDYKAATIWNGDGVITTADTALQQAGLNLAVGSASQTPWGYVTSMHPDQALAYRGIAYVYAQDYPLNETAAIPNHSFEVKFNIHVSGKDDANPKDIMVDLLTNPLHGLPGWSSGLIGDLTIWSDYCLANNLLLSPVVDTARPARDLINEWCEITNSAAFWSEGVVKVGTYGDAAATANGVTFTPNLTPIYALTENDFVPLEDYIPVSVEIRNQSDAYNIVQVEFLDRANQYNVAVSPSQDLANISEYGKRKQDPVNWHAICDSSVARLASQLLLQRTLYRREIYTFRLPWNFVLLDPMDYVSLTTTTDQLKLNNKLVQIIAIEEGEDDCLTFTAEAVNVGSGSAPLYNAYTGDAVSVQTQITPVPVSPPVMVNAPSSLTGLDPEVWIAVAGANANWGGCEVWISADNVTYQKVGTIVSPAKIGVSTAILPDSADPDNVNTLSLDMSLSGQELTSSSSTNANAGSTLFVLGNEIMAYQTATLTSANHYNLTTLRRGLYSTTHSSHPSGSTFARLDEAVFKISYTDLNFGDTMYVKLPSFNSFGLTTESLSSAVPYSISLLSSTNAVDWRVVADQKVIAGFLTNEVHTVAAASDGTGYSLTGSGGTFKVYNGDTDVTTSAAFSVSGSATKNGLTITIDSSGNYSLSGAAWSTDNESFTLQAVFNGVTIQKDYSISKSKAGTSGASASILTLSNTAQTFTYDGAGSASPASQTITFTANLQNLSGTVAWTATGYNSSGTSLGAITLSGTGNTRTMSNTQFGAAAYAVVTASLSGYSDTTTVVRLTAGATGTNGLNNALVYIYQRAASAPALPSASVTYTFATGAISGLNNGWSATIPGGTNPLYVSIATASNANATDTIASSEWASPVVLAQNGTDGSAGINAATVYLFQRTTGSTPSLPSTTTTYTFATGVATGFNNGWNTTMPTTGGSYRWMTTASALGTGATDTIASSEWATAALLSQDGTDSVSVTISNNAYQLFAYADGSIPSYSGASGQLKVYNGAVDVTTSSTLNATGSTGVTGSINASGAYSVTGLTQNSGTLTLTAVYGGVTYTRVFSVSKLLTGYEIVSALPSTNLFQGRMVFLTTDNKLYRYTGSAWTPSVAAVDLTGTITATQIGTDAVTTPKILAGSVTAGKIYSGTVEADLIQTNNLAAGSITAAKVGTNEIIALTANIKDGVISTAKIGDLQVTTGKIGDLQVETLKVANNAITVPVSAYTAAGMSATSGTWMLAQSVSIVCTGAPVYISASCSIAFHSTSSNEYVRITRNGTEIYNATMPQYPFTIGNTFGGVVSPSISDNPGAGTIVYNLEVMLGRTATNLISNRSLFCLETKK